MTSLAESGKLKGGSWTRRRHARLGLNLLMMLAVTAGIGSLLLEFGFYRLPPFFTLHGLHVAEMVVAVLLASDRLARLALADDRRSYLRQHWVGLALLVLAPLAALLVPLFGLQRVFGLNSYVLIAQSYLVIVLLLRGVELNIFAAGSGIHPTRLLVGSFMFLILVGTGLLMLPKAVPHDAPPLFFEDALFIATSATCVTGLAIFDIGSRLTHFGQTVMLCLIQLGGLGIMIFGTLFAILGGRLNLRQTAALGEMVSTRNVGQIARTIQFIVASTLLIELLGAILLLPVWAGRPDGAFSAVFHSVSAFCNAGFSLEKENLVLLRERWQILSVIPLLIILGGLGFPVLYDLVTRLPQMLQFLLRRNRRNPGIPRANLTLQTKVVLVTTAALLVLGTLGLMLVEPAAGPRPTQLEAKRSFDGGWEQQRLTDWQQVRGGNRLAQAWFQSASARTAGFNTINLDQLSNAGQLWLIVLMLIGGSPASTAGGMKTVTFAVLVMLFWSALRNRERVEIFHRNIADDTVRRAATFAGLYLTLVTVITLLLSMAQGPNARFMDVLFESVSACGTVGTSLGETARLTLAGKYVIVAGMFAGRVGPLTLLMSMIIRSHPARYSYPTEDLTMG